MVTSNFQYDLIIAEPYLCVAALLEIIIKPYNGFINQKIIAEYFGVTIPENADFPVENCTTSDEPNQYGIKIKKDFQQFFDEYSIPFHDDYIHISSLQDWEFEDAIIVNLKLGRHIICGFDYDLLFQNSPSMVGHVVLITGYDINKEEIAIIDPGPKNPGRKIVKSYDLYRAIRHKDDGLWLISVKKVYSDIER